MKKLMSSLQFRRTAAFWLAGILLLSVMFASCSTGSLPDTSGSSDRNTSKSTDSLSGESASAESAAVETSTVESASDVSVMDSSIPDEPAALLTDAADAVWINDIIYDYQDIAPIMSTDFSDLGGKFMEGTNALIRREQATSNRVDLYEFAYTSYSPIEEYYLYQPADSDVWRFFHMPTLTASEDTGWAGEASTLPGSIMPYLSGADGIPYGNSPEGRTEPWDLLLFGSRPSAVPALLYDEVTGISYLYVESQMGDCAMRRLEPGILHKPYRANIEYTILHDNLPEDTEGLLLWQSVDENGGYYPQGTVYTPDSYVGPTDTAASQVVFIGTDATPLSISPKYTDAAGFSNGYAAVAVNGKWGFIDETGHEVILCVFDPAPDYGYTVYISGRPVTVLTAYPSTDETAVVFKDGECALLSMDGTYLIGFGVFEDMAPSFENQLWVKTTEGWRLLDLAALKTLQ